MRNSLMTLFFTCAFSLVTFSALGAETKNTVPLDPKVVTSIDAKDLLKKIAAEKGKVVVINIFASWCPPCREEAPGLIATRKAFEDKDLFLVGVSVDKTMAALHHFLSDYPFNYPIFVAEGQFVETFGVNAIPQLLIYDRKGELVYNHKGLVSENELKELISNEVTKK